MTERTLDLSPGDVVWLGEWRERPTGVWRRRFIMTDRHAAPRIYVASVVWCVGVFRTIVEGPHARDIDDKPTLAEAQQAAESYVRETWGEP